jgi:histidinol-phosphatase
MLLAEGAVDIACEPDLALHDMAACSIVVTEAGGQFTDVDGVPGPHGAGAYATNGRLHEEVLAQFADFEAAEGTDGELVGD